MKQTFEPLSLTKHGSWWVFNIKLIVSAEVESLITRSAIRKSASDGNGANGDKLGSGGMEGGVSLLGSTTLAGRPVRGW